MVKSTKKSNKGAGKKAAPKTKGGKGGKKRAAAEPVAAGPAGLQRR